MAHEITTAGIVKTVLDSIIQAVKQNESTTVCATFPSTQPGQYNSFRLFQFRSTCRTVAHH